MDKQRLTRKEFILKAGVLLMGAILIRFQGLASLFSRKNKHSALKEAKYFSVKNNLLG